jgi:3-oxoacyl-[acyl-carrier protein] reductase
MVCTDMLEQMDAKARESLLNATALRRVAEPDEVANAILFLASDLASFISGQVLRVDGGMA